MFVDTISSVHNLLIAMHVLSDTPNGTVDTPATPKSTEFVCRQARDKYFHALISQVEKPDAEFQIDYHKLLVHRLTIDGAIQVVVPALLRQQTLALAQCPPMVGHPKYCRMYETLWCKLYWPEMANEVYSKIDCCSSCVRICNNYRHKRRLQLFSSVRSLEFVVRDILGPFPKTRIGKQYVVAVTKCYSKLTLPIPSSKTTSAHTASIFLLYWIVLYGIPSFIFTDNDKKLVSKFFATLCRLLGVKHLTTAAYHPQTNEQPEVFNRTIVIRLWHFFAKHLRDWNTFVQPHN